jgi:hypothetical protein
MLNEDSMYQTTASNSRILLVRSENESDLTELLHYINEKIKMKKQDLVNHFLDFAAHNYNLDPDFKFNRDECYER